MPSTAETANVTQADVPSSSAADMPFPSLVALRAAHKVLLDQHRTQAEAEAFWREVDLFLRRGSATGMLLDNEDDRWAVQGLLDYWAATAMK